MLSNPDESAMSMSVLDVVEYIQLLKPLFVDLETLNPSHTIRRGEDYHTPAAILFGLSTILRVRFVGQEISNHLMFNEV